MLVDIANGEFYGSAYNLPFNEVVPFNMNSIFGWILTWFCQLNVQHANDHNNDQCFCPYIVAMCTHFSLLIDRLRFDSQQIPAEANAPNRQRLWLNAKVELQHASELHADIYE